MSLSRFRYTPAPTAPTTIRVMRTFENAVSFTATLSLSTNAAYVILKSGHAEPKGAEAEERVGAGLLQPGQPHPPGRRGPVRADHVLVDPAARGRRRGGPVAGPRRGLVGVPSLGGGAGGEGEAAGDRAQGGGGDRRAQPRLPRAVQTAGGDRRGDPQARRRQPQPR